MSQLFQPANPAKRARANLAGDSYSRVSNPNPVPAETNPDKIRQQVQHLSREQLTDIVIAAAQAHSDLNATIGSTIQATREKERNRVINFDHYSSSVWKEINITYRRMSGSKQYVIAWDVADGVNLRGV